ncbi:MAG: ABC transporter permease [Rhizobiales bacterium]|nr:ABC transporter permease [Hyphomicrobiales bacterium]OJX98702.1 MAG: ABC transporter permease [Rhizobiales bacterium 63-22]
MANAATTLGTPGKASGARRRDASFSYLIPALLLVVIFFIVPVLMLLLRSVTDPHPGLQNYAALLGSTTYLKVFVNTFVVAGLVTVISVVIGYPVAWLLAIMPERWSRLVLAIIILSMWTNLLTRTYAWMVLLQRTGVINKVLIGIGLIDRPLTLVNNLVGVTIGMTYIMLPFVILPLMGVIRALDPATLRAAALCGATKTQCFTRVLLPLSMPGIAAGALMVFVMSLGYFVTPALLGGTSNMMLAELITQFVQSLVDWGMGGAAALVLLVVTLALYAVQLRYFNPNRAR